MYCFLCGSKLIRNKEYCWNWQCSNEKCNEVFQSYLNHDNSLELIHIKTQFSKNTKSTKKVYDIFGK